MRPVQAIGFFLLFLASESIGQTSIRIPPTITKQPKKLNIFRDEGAVILECQADGSPEIIYKWEKNGVELNQSSLLNIKVDANDTGTGTITIDPATRLDEGYYQCFATNQYGTAPSIVSNARKAVSQLNSGTGVNNVTVREGEAFHIQVARVNCFPEPIYSWEVVSDTSDRGSQPVSLSKRIQQAENGDLHFAYAKVEDGLNGKIYKCLVYNPYLDVKSGGSYTRVIVTGEGRADSAPKLDLGFSSKPQIVGLVNGSVTLRCFFNGKPESTIDWNRPGSTLPRDRYRRNTHGTELIISTIMASDEGNYTCTARNGVGAEASHTIQLIIETEPSIKRIDDRPHNVNVSEGETVTFNCKADAKPEADVVWFRNGKVIKDAPTRYVISPDKKSLTIADICLSCKDRDKDKGTDITVIQCNASNRHGYAFASGYLNVFQKTKVDVEGEKFLTVDIDNGTVEVELKCSVKYDPTTPVKWTWYKRESYGNYSKDENLRDRLKTLISINEGSVKIRIDLDNATVAKLLLLAAWRQHFGRYICVADNGISQSNGTIELEQLIPVTTPLATTTEPPPPNCFFFDLPYAWLCFVVIAGVALLIVAFCVICICCLCYHNRHRDEYDVDGKERWTGSNPEKELLANDFHESYRVETISRTLKSSKASLSSATLMRIAEESSLNDYGDDMGKFTEDGSFVGNYNTQSRGGYM